MKTKILGRGKLLFRDNNRIRESILSRFYDLPSFYRDYKRFSLLVKEEIEAANYFIDSSRDNNRIRDRI